MKSQQQFEGKWHNYQPVKRANERLTDHEYLETRLEDQISWHKRKSVWNKQKYLLLKNVESIVAALVPVSLGLGSVIYGDLGEGASHHISVWLTRGVSAVSGVYLAISSGFFELEGYEQKAKDYRKLYKKLETIKFKYLTRAEPYDEEDAFPRMIYAVENTLHEDLINYFSAMDKSAAEEKEQKVQEEVNERAS